MQGAGDRVDGGDADPSPDASHRSVVLDLRGHAQWPRNVQDTVSLFQGSQLLRRLADDLEDDGDRTLFPAIIGDGHGDPFRLVVQAQDDELAGLRFSGDGGGIYLYQLDRQRQVLLFNNLVHDGLCLLSSFVITASSRDSRFEIRLKSI